MATKTTALHLKRLLILILAFGFVTPAEAVTAMKPTSIEIFATSDQLISVVDTFVDQLPDIEVRIHKLDGIKQLEGYLSEGLPANPDKARQLALERLQHLSKATRSQLERSATALAQAVQYGVEQYPAIVFDGELVMYGLTDLSVALTHYRHWQQGQTS